MGKSKLTLRNSVDSDDRSCSPFADSSVDSEWPNCAGKNDTPSPRCKVRKFGESETGHDWIECESKSFPGTTYFFNLRSSCSCWNRPVSRYVDIPRFSYAPKKYLQESTFDTDSPPLIVSEDEEDTKGKRKFTKEETANTSTLVPNILSHLYYDPRECEISNNCIDTSKDYNKNERSFGSSTENSESESVFLISDFLETDLTCVGGTVNFSYNISNKTNFQFRSSESVSSSDSDEEFEASPKLPQSSNGYPSLQKFSVPRLKRITSSDLLDCSQRKPKRARQRLVSKETKKQPTIIVCEMYGTKTINYDHVDDFPPGTKVSNLSDTSSVASSHKSSKKIVSNASERTEYYNLLKNVKEPVLSESSPATSDSLNSSSDSSSESEHSCTNHSCSTCSSDTSKSFMSTKSNVSCESRKSEPTSKSQKLNVHSESDQSKSSCKSRKSSSGFKSGSPDQVTPGSERSSTTYHSISSNKSYTSSSYKCSSPPTSDTYVTA